MSSITVNTLVLGSLTVSVDGTDSTLALAVLGTAPASLTIELGTPGAQGDAATIAVGTTTTLSPGASATVTNVGTSSAAVFNFGIPAGQTGATGATGSQGPAGTAATVTAGTTTTGAAGSSASVTNSGTSSAAVFDFTIPRGDTGATGATGATGPAGPGVAAGGTAGQSLLKVDGTDYNTTWGTPALASHAETTQATVRNSTGSTLTPGQIVYINGALGNRPTVALSQANSEATSAGTYAMVEASIPNNTDGTVITAGTVMNLDTSALADGDKLYLSPTTAGAWTTTKPSAPNHLVYIGTVTRVHPTLGTVQLRIQNGYELDELHDVAIASKANNDLLAYESSTGLWKNKTLAALDVQTATGAASTYAAKASNLSDLTNASTARTNLGLGTAAVEPATKLVPTGGTTGQVLTKNSATNWDIAWATPSAGGGGVDVQTFGSSTTSGSFTWTKPANAKLVTVFMWGGGGGGGSGACQPNTNNRFGGGGGAGGTFTWFQIHASYLNATETVVVGAGGASVAGVSTTSNGNNGNNGGDSTFKIWKAVGGGGGSGGTTTAGTAGTSKTSWVLNASQSHGIAGAGTSSNGGSGTIYTSWHILATGGGGGAGCTAGVSADRLGGAGGNISTALNNSGINVSIAGGNGAVTASDATAGTTTGLLIAGTGGGGGMYRVATTTPTRFNGAAGGWPAGGGGGGGAADTGLNTSGSGGAGANGYVYIMTNT